MEYTIKKLGEMAGISTRTLRYYDEIGLLKPARINSSGYRIYGKAEVDQLQHILFFRELGVSLEDIKEILNSPTFNSLKILQEHREKLLEKRNQLDILIANVEKTIAYAEGRITMSDREKFAGFKQKMIEDNEKKYGKEIRAKYGDERVDNSYKKLMNMTEEQYQEWEKLGSEILENLKEALKIGDPASEIALKTAELHHRWLRYCWGSYSKEAHAGLAQMYVDDERFTAYYDNQVGEGASLLLRDAILIYTGQKEVADS
ncbi:MAG: MerR family transcriptional regulator [Syntrophomonadaceae bacterium]|nr:MerR family transcriptional regulator [Syntrophomonadaceae bacterium]